MTNKLTPEEVKAIQNDPDNVMPIVNVPTLEGKMYPPLRPQTIEEQARNYVEDLADFDRGNYICTCTICKLTFQGYKRRITCKSCLIKSQEQSIQSLKNGKTLQSLHDQIVMLEVKNAALEAKVEELKDSPQVTERELSLMFEQEFEDNDFFPANPRIQYGKYKDGNTEMMWKGFLAAARLLGRVVK